MVWVVKEPEYLGFPYENCCICDVGTCYWYEPNDVPLCKKCAPLFHRLNKHKVPSKEEWFFKGAVGSRTRRII